MTLLTPAFLAGLVAVAVPILVHLVHRQRVQTVAFPSLMFLQKVPYRSVRRQRLRHRMLLVLRCLALVLLALAFARPFFGGATPAVAAVGGARERVILLDRSYSMGYAGRWDRALQAARAALADLVPGDQATLVLFADTAEIPHGPRADAVEIRAVLEGARPAARVTRYAPALKLAQERLAATGRPRREAVLITDFQKSGWAGHEDARLPDGTELRLVDVGEAEAGNVAVTGLTFQREYGSGRERVAVVARVANRGTKPARGVPLALELGGRVVEERRVDLGPNSAETVGFTAVPLPVGASRGMVRAAADALPADDVFHFVLSPGDAVNVLVIEGRGARANRSLYFGRALAIGDRPRMKAELRRTGEVGPGDLDGRAVFVLNESPFPSGPAGARLRERVEGGAGLLVVAAEGGARAWPPGLLPAAIGESRDRTAVGGGTLAYLDRGHPVFELFAAPRSGDFSSARFLRYRPLAPGPGAAVLARFDDGAVALAEGRVGKGRVAVWASTLDTFWNDLAIRPVFLPFVHQLVKHLAGHAEARTSFTVGEVVEVGGTGERVVVAPDGQSSVLAAGARFLELAQPGFHEVRAPGGSISRLLAANADRAESDLARVDPEEVEAALVPAGGGVAAGAWDAEETAADRERRQGLWRLVLALAVALLVAETALGNRLSSAVPSKEKVA